MRVQLVLLAPIVGPIIGGVIGVLLYVWFIGDILHARRALAEQATAAAPTGGSQAAPPQAAQEPRPAGEEDY